MKEQFTTIQSIGRTGLLERLKKFKGKVNARTVKGSGDDSAILKTKSKHLQLLTTDTYIEGVDFDPSYTPFTHFGYKMVSSAISDI